MRFLIFLGIILLGWNTAQAYTTNRYNTCTGWADSSSLNCSESGGTAEFNFNASSDNYSANANTTGTPFLTAGTWYLSADLTTSAGTLRFCDNDETCFSSGTDWVAYEFTSTGSAYLQWYSNGTFIGSVKSLCITDTSGQCELPPEEQATTSATATTTANMETTLFNGMVLFLGTFGLLAFYFKKNK